jgi:hypothetical protein
LPYRTTVRVPALAAFSLPVGKVQKSTPTRAAET